VSVDAHAFDGAIARGESDRALALYQGRFLSDFQRFDAPDFNAWVDRKAAHYERLHRRARRDRIRQLLEHGDRASALAVAQHWSELDPVEDEAVHRTLELLHELGRRSEALQTYEAYVQRLKEVELVPLEDTRTLAARVRESSGVTLAVSAPPPERMPARHMALPHVPTFPDSKSPGLAAEARALAWHRRPWVRATSLIGALAVIAGVAFILPSRRGEMRSAALPLDSAGYDLSRVAVLYFDDHTAGGTLDYLAKGLTEALIEELSRVEALSVVPRLGVKPYQNTNVTTDSIARALNVGTIVQGSLQRWGDSVQVTVQLLDARSRAHLDGRALRRPIGSGFQLEDDVVREVGAFLRRRLGREIQLRRIARGATRQEAYRLYQTADDFREQVLSANPRQRASDPRKYEFLLSSADSMLAQAERIDPQWLEPALLRGWLAYDRGILTNAPGSSVSDAYLRTAISIANRLLQKQARNAGALELRASANIILANNVVGAPAADSLLRQAEVQLKEAVGIDYTRASAWFKLGRLTQYRGELDEAWMYVRRARTTDAFLRETPEIINRLVRIAMDREQFTEAKQWCREGHDEFPTDVQFLECQLMVSAVNPAPPISRDSMYALKRELWRLVAPDPDGPRDYQHIFWETLIARLWARHNRADSALTILARLRRTVAGADGLAPPFGFDAAHVRLLAGDTAGALEDLKAFLTLNPHLRNYVATGVAFRGITHRLTETR
ncbi:MAG: BTAD domain-containing putative transcriptional regulator, partial [Longimicrobiales bacterium]